jgi:hypothetical protein
MLSFSREEPVIDGQAIVLGECGSCGAQTQVYDYYGDCICLKCANVDEAETRMSSDPPETRADDIVAAPEPPSPARRVAKNPPPSGNAFVRPPAD